LRAAASRIAHQGMASRRQATAASGWRRAAQRGDIYISFSCAIGRRRERWRGCVRQTGKAQREGKAPGRRKHGKEKKMTLTRKHRQNVGVKVNKTTIACVSQNFRRRQTSIIVARHIANVIRMSVRNRCRHHSLRAHRDIVSADGGVVAWTAVMCIVALLAQASSRLSP
jgi:hypothetical protein